MITAALHVIAVILFFTVPWQAPWRRPQYVMLEPLEVGDSLVFVSGVRERAARGPTIQTTRREPEPRAAVPPLVVAAPAADTGSAMPAYDANANRITPQVGDGRLWVSPRPPLPSAVAEALYGDSTERRAVAVERLRAMVDSLNQVLDVVQRERRRPSWTIGGGKGHRSSASTRNTSTSRGSRFPRWPWRCSAISCRRATSMRGCEPGS